MGQPDPINDDIVGGRGEEATVVAAGAVPPHLKKKYERPGGPNGHNNVVGSPSPGEEEAGAQRAWAAVRDGGKDGASLGEVIVENVSLPRCETVHDFVSTFLSDSAPHPLAAYQSKIIGDTELTTTPWTPTPPTPTPTSSSPSAVTESRRTVTYRHPISAGPMAPPSARATKSQHLRQFGRNTGLCLDTITTVCDVPISDCFHVTDRILVEPNPEGGVSLTVTFEVKFVKRTMFKKIVEKTTGEEVREFWRGYVEFVREALAGNGSLGAGDAPPATTEEGLSSMMDNLMSGLEEIAAPFFDCCAAAVNGVADEGGRAVAAAMTAWSEEEEEDGGGDDAAAKREDEGRQEDDDDCGRGGRDGGGVELTYLPGLGREMEDVRDGDDCTEEEEGPRSSASDAAAAAYFREVVRNALMKKLREEEKEAKATVATEIEERSEWELLSEKVYASLEWTTSTPEGSESSGGEDEKGSDEMLLGYSAFEDAVVVAALLSCPSSGRAEDTAGGRTAGGSAAPSVGLPSMEVALFEEGAEDASFCNRHDRPLIVL